MIDYQQFRLDLIKATRLPGGRQGISAFGSLEDQVTYGGQSIRTEG